MLNQSTAFDLICDCIKDRKQFTANLVAQASDGTPKNYLNLESFIFSKGYKTIQSGHSIIYQVI